MRKETITSIVQNCLMVLLFAAMLVQCVLYIGFARIYEDSVLPPFPEGEQKILASGGSALSDAGRAYLFPYFVAGVSEEGKYGGAYDDEAAYNVFKLFAEVIKNAPGGTAKKVLFSETVKKYDYLEKLYGEMENCYYVKLKNGIEFSVLCQLASDTYVQLPENPDFVISDMFLVSGATGEASITAVDAMGNVLKIYPSKSIEFNSEYLEAYNSTDKDEFEFVRVQNNVNRNRNCYFPVYKYSVEHKSIVKRDFTEFFDIGGDNKDIIGFMSAFGMNDDNTKFYRRSNDGAIICVEDLTTFEISPDGIFSFAPGSGGGSMDLFLQNTDGSSYGFSDYANAAGNIAEALMGQMSESCATLSLEDITYSGGECSFYYNYTVDGIPVEHKIGDYGLVLRFRADKLISAQGNVFIASESEAVRTEMPQKTAYILMEENSFPVMYFGAEYCFGTEPETENYGTVRWSAMTENDFGGEG